MFKAATFIVVLLLCLYAPLAQGQIMQPGLVNINADNLENKILNGEEVMILTGNVRFTHGMINGSSDKATQYKALGKVILEGNVEIRQDVMLLKAPYVEYNSISGNAKAEQGVFVSDRDASVTAKKGYYNLNLQKADFHGDVKANQVGTFITSDSLSYFRTSQTTYASGNAEVTSDSGKLTASELTSVRITGETIANGNVVLTDDSTELYCEHFYDSKTAGLTTASTNVAFYDKKNITWLLADTLARLRDEGRIHVPRNPTLLILDTTSMIDSTSGAAITRTDTLLISSLTMTALTGDTTVFYAEDSVKLFRNNFAGVGNSLTYHQKSEEMTMHGEGRQRIWYDSTELDCDSVILRTNNKKIDKIFAFGKPFLTTPYEDTTVHGRVNQLSSQRMILTMSGDSIRNLLAIDNAISLYFVSSENKPSGINRATGDSLRVDFQMNKPTGITIIHETEGEYIPERYVKGRGAAFRLSTFERHTELTPTRDDFQFLLPANLRTPVTNKQ